MKRARALERHSLAFRTKGDPGRIARRPLAPFQYVHSSAWVVTLVVSCIAGHASPARAQPVDAAPHVNFIQAASFQQVSLDASAEASDSTQGSLAGSTEADSRLVGSEADTSDDSVALPDTGFEWGMKLGIELPLGKTDGAGVTVRGTEFRSGDLGGVALLNVPIALDLGYRTSRHWWWGLEAGAGLGPEGDDCPDDMLCDFNSLRLSAQVIYNVAPDTSTQPWIGALLGYEWLRPSVTQVITVPANDGGEQQVPIGAKEFLSGPHIALEGGLQFSLADHVRLGPFISAALGAYLTDSFECASNLSCPERDTVDGIRLHSWLGLGLRGTHGP